MAKKANTAKEQCVVISAPNIKGMALLVTGTAPYVQQRFSEKAKDGMHTTQAAGSTVTKGAKRKPKDFQAAYEASLYRSNGHYGIPASAFRCALISACKMCGFKMTLAKLSMFIEADGLDDQDGTPLVFITSGEPQYFESPVRNSNGGTDLRVRAKWVPGWKAVVRVSYDADQFTQKDVVNLFMRVGLQVGVGEGRPDSRRSAGCGWGRFSLDE